VSAIWIGPMRILLESHMTKYANQVFLLSFIPISSVCPQSTNQILWNDHTTLTDQSDSVLYVTWPHIDQWDLLFLSLHSWSAAGERITHEISQTSTPR
jgi:hypothetical protein